MNDFNLLRRPLSPANRRCHLQRVPESSGLSLGLRGFGIFDAVEAFASEYGKDKAPSPAAQDLPQGDGFILVKIALIFFIIWAWRPYDLLSPRRGLCQARWPFLPGPARRNSRKKGRPPECSALQRICPGHCPLRNSLRSGRRSGRRHRDIRIKIFVFFYRNIACPHRDRLSVCKDKLFLQKINNDDTGRLLCPGSLLLWR